MPIDPGRVPGLSRLSRLRFAPDNTEFGRRFHAKRLVSGRKPERLAIASIPACRFLLIFATTKHKTFKRQPIHFQGE